MHTILSGGRIGFVVVLWLSLALPALGAEPHGACSAVMRVMVSRTPGPVRLVIDGRERVLAPSRKHQIQLDGRSVGPQWEIRPSQEARVAGLSLSGRLVASRLGPDLVLVNEVPLEAYVAGAITGEMPTGWSTAALRAQAVASRTFALHQRAAHRKRGWDVEAGTRSQVYGGRKAAAAARDAARDTQCQVLTASGRPILAAFHSASGGRTASAAEVWGREVPYLVSVEVFEEEDSPDTYWRTRIARSTLARSLEKAGHALGQLHEAKIEDRTPSGRVRWVRFRGARGEVRLSGREVRQMVGESTVRSTLFELRPEGEDLVFVGSGSGHGVGMSQWGARGLAAKGSSYRDILRTFYPGARLSLWNRGQVAAFQKK